MSQTLPYVQIFERLYYLISISDEYCKEHNISLSEDDDDISDDECDSPEWKQTPLIRRIKKIRETTLNNGNAKRKLGTTLDVGSDEGPPKPKRSISASALGM